MLTELTDDTLRVFLMYAKDAGNWGGLPWVSNGNISPTKADRGNLSDLVKKGLIKIEEDSELGRYVAFTPAGSALAGHHGIILN